MLRNISLPAVLTAVLFLSTGCVKLTLNHTAMPAAAPSAGQVSVQVNDAREKDRGQGNERHVGQLRNMYGMRIKMEAQNSLTAELTTIAKESLTSAGFTVTDNAPVIVVVDILDFWMDGYMGYKIDTKFKLSVKKDGTETFSKELTKSDGVGNPNTKRINAAFKRLLDTIAAEMLTVIKSPEFQTAAAQ
ncbi:MAG: hypothetical protein JXR91_13630 [Deltaproteobacteria bacterium]|nr:hypothetical protein [Deltaproteobacteria bacterium]